MSESLFQKLAAWTLIAGYISALLRGRNLDCMTRGSSNAMITGDGYIRAFNGVTLLAGKTGSRLFFTTDSTFSGLGTPLVNGAGSVFQVRRLLMYIGAGQVYFDGAAISGAIAGSTLSYIKKTGSAYTPGPTTGPFQAGHAQPSAPSIFAKVSPSAGHTPMTGVVTMVIWRLDDLTGQPSLMSLPSNSLTLNGHSVIVQVPLPDANAQNYWGFGGVKIGFDDLGVYYAIPTSLGGEVAESVLSYTRTVTGASIANTTNVVDITDPDSGDQFTAADIGRRIAFGAFNSWITAINSATQVQVFDTNSSGGTISGTATVTHAVDGITRAVEISWTNGAIARQPLAPDKAYPPVAAQFSGNINDVLFLDSDGIIYVGEPGYVGSFPPSNAIFAPEPAVAYLRFSKGLMIRFGKNTMGTLYYVGGSPALEYQTHWEHQGIAYPQNAALGANGRLLTWLGRPTVMSVDTEPDHSYADDVMPDFDGWNEQQTADAPICPGWDARGKYEIWAFKKKVMAKLVTETKGGWCAPIDLTGKIPGDIQDVLAHNRRLYLSCVNGATHALYEFDAGTGSVMVVRTDDARRIYDATINQVTGQVRADNVANPVRVEVIINNDDANPILISADARTTPNKTETQELDPFAMQPNVLNAKTHALKITMTSTGGDCGPDMFETWGASTEALTK